MRRKLLILLLGISIVITFNLNQIDVVKNVNALELDNISDKDVLINNKSIFYRQIEMSYVKLVSSTIVAYETIFTERLILTSFEYRPP